MGTGAFLHPFASTTRTEFVPIVSGQGARVKDVHGNEYVDAMASLWCVNAGYGRGEIVAAIEAQLRLLPVFHCFEPFTNEPADALAARIAALAPLDDPRVFFTCSGSEAVDSAIKLARMAQRQAGHPERTIIVSRDRGYHGVTYGGMTAQGLPLNREGFGPFVEGMVNLPADDVEAMAAFLAEHGPQVAAVLTEPVQGAGGVYPPDEGYLAALRRLCDQHGCYLILDEVICGFGRLGHWFGAERFGVRPDLLTFAKGVTSGYQPLGGVVVGGAPRAALEADATFILRHGHTYSGHPTACAAGLANLDIVEGERLAEGAVRIAGRLGAGLQALAADGQIAEARGDGGMWAAGLHPHQDATKVRDAMLAAGVITRAIGAPTLTFCPPLVIDDADLDRIVDALGRGHPLIRPAVALLLDRNFEVPYGRVEQVTPLVRRLVADNPGPFTFKGTGTYLVGRGEVAVVDPGPDLPEHLEALLAAVAGEQVTHVLVTHTHRDHSPAAATLREATGATVLAFGPHPTDPGTLVEDAADAGVTTEEPYDAAFAPDVRVGEGDEVAGSGWTFEVLHTPGHIANHLCFALREERALFPGDHVMGWSTTVVAPPLGDMGDYLVHLRRLLDRDDEVYWPTHGPAVRAPHDLVRGLIEHRYEREAQVLARLDAGDRQIPEIVVALNADVDERLHKAAGRSVLAHLLLLREQGRVVAEGPLGAGATWHR